MPAKERYYIQYIRPGDREAHTMQSIAGDGPALFATTAEATRAAAGLMDADKGISDFFVKEYGDPEWRDRERLRFAKGEYRACTFATHDAWLRAIKALQAKGQFCAFFAHPATGRPEKIAYTPDEEAGRLDRKTVVSPGRFLERFAGAPYMSKDMIRAFANDHVARFGGNAIKFARTPEEITNVYRNGPRSCMSYVPSDYQSQTYPVSIYGAGDLACAYLETSAGINARCIVWPEKKQWNRVYGDPKLQTQLEDLGYKKVNSFDGARLLCIRENGRIVAPHIDGGHRNLRMEKDEEGREYLVIDHTGTICADQTSGFAQATRTCDLCAKEAGERSFIEMRIRSGTNENARRAWACNSCADTSYRRCSSCNYYCLSSEAQQIGGQLFCMRCARDAIKTCGICAAQVNKRDIFPIMTVPEVFVDYCHNCVEANRDHIRYCNECHHLLTGDAIPDPGAPRKDTYCARCRP